MSEPTQQDWTKFRHELARIEGEKAKILYEVRAEQRAAKRRRTGLLVRVGFIYVLLICSIVTFTLGVIPIGFILAVSAALFAIDIKSNHGRVWPTWHKTKW